MGFVRDSFLKYLEEESYNISVGTNGLNERNYVESVQEEEMKEDNEEQVDEGWSSYPSSIPNNGDAQTPMKTPSYIIANYDDLYCDDPILDESFDVNSFYGKSYDSWVEKIFEKDTNDSNSATPPTNENEEYCFDILNDSAIDDDSLLLDSPPCGTIVSRLWEDAHDIKEIDDTLSLFDDWSLCGDSTKNYVVEFVSNACNYYERRRNNSPLYVFTLLKMKAY